MMKSNVPRMRLRSTARLLATSLTLVGCMWTPATVTIGTG